MTALVLLGGVAGCSDDDGSSGGGSGSAEGYPMTLASPFGETTLDGAPTRVAVVSDIDLDIALALGVEPVIAPKYGDVEISEWTQDAAAELGSGDLATYDASDGTDFEAIAESEPDVILATSGYTLSDDYEQLSQIAPIVSYQGELSEMSWIERTEAAAVALDRSDEADQVVADVEAEFARVRAENPDFEGVTYTQANVHPDQISYESYEGSDTSFFTDLGFVLPPQAADFSASDLGLSKENIDQLEADVLFMGYPFGDEGLLTRDALESDPLFQSLSVVQAGRYAVIPDELASPLTYKTPLSVPWVLEQLTPAIVAAVAGTTTP
jgi:iron complex transport system substrate-binding protein